MGMDGCPQRPVAGAKGIAEGSKGRPGTNAGASAEKCVEDEDAATTLPAAAEALSLLGEAGAAAEPGRRRSRPSTTSTSRLSVRLSVTKAGR